MDDERQARHECIDLSFHCPAHCVICPGMMDHTVSNVASSAFEGINCNIDNNSAMLPNDHCFT